MLEGVLRFCYQTYRHWAVPTLREDVPLLSCFLAGSFVGALGRLAPPGPQNDLQIVRQHPQTHLDPHPRQTPPAEPTKTPVRLRVGEPQLDRLAPPLVQRLRLRLLHL